MRQTAHNFLIPKRSGSSLRAAPKSTSPEALLHGHLRRPGNHTRSPSRQLDSTPAADLVSTEHLRILSARIAAIEKTQAENVKDNNSLKSKIRTIKDGLEEVRTEVTERSAEAIERVDQHNALTF